MLRWSSVIASQVRNEELRREAAHERWVKTVLTKTDRRPRFYQSIAFQFGCWLTSAGQRLQKRYSVMVEPTLTSKMGSNQGAC
jgi:hypothetical protein